MKINKLTIKNLNSLKGQHVINFEDELLSNAGIIAITGPTGAGKTTLLDAICLALYNRIPRSSAAISKNLIQQIGGVCTRNTTDSLAEVEYTADGQTYRSSWTIRINNRGNLADYQMEVADINGQIIEDKRSEVPSCNAKIIGLGTTSSLSLASWLKGIFPSF